MPKSDLFPLIVAVVAAFAGYLAVDPAAAQQLTNWLRQEIRKEIPDAKSVGHPNYTPVVPSQGL